MVGTASLWLQADTEDFVPRPQCHLLYPELTSTWIALAEHARQQQLLTNKLGLVVAFDRDMKSVEKWFRHQATDEELQKHLRKPHDAPYNARLAAEMLHAGAFDRFANVLRAMGLSITSVSIEKVDVRSSARWRQVLPESTAWELPSKHLLALPYLTALALQPIETQESMRRIP